jgi:hypothetical protein
LDIKANEKDYKDLQLAVGLLEAPSITAKLSSLIGSPIESLVAKLPNSVSSKLHGAVEAALHKSANAALWSLENTPAHKASTKLHKLYAASSGAIGGFFGFTAMFVELPISTTIMMRAVADVARSEGFDLENLATKRACIEVFALGGNTADDDGTDTGYYVVRGFASSVAANLSKPLAEIAAQQAGKGVASHGFKLAPQQAANWLAALIEKVASRFGVVISNKFAAQAVPIIGAVSGAAVNTLFTDFYQDMARGHFTIMRLEQKYGPEHIKAAYEAIRKT